MRKALFCVVFLLLGAGFVQTAPKQTNAQKIPVYITHVGNDDAGNQFVAAVKRALSGSEKYAPVPPTYSPNGFRLYIDVLTSEQGASKGGEKGSSVASVVIEELGLPNSYPVASMWYHKLFALESGRPDETAQRFLSDMDAHWCNHIKSSVGNCPKESLFPVVQ